MRGENRESGRPLGSLSEGVCLRGLYTQYLEELRAVEDRLRYPTLYGGDRGTPPDAQREKDSRPRGPQRNKRIAIRSSCGCESDSVAICYGSSM